MSNKLDDRGILTKEAIYEIIMPPELRAKHLKYYGEIRTYGGTMDTGIKQLLTAERNALLELFETWIEEADETIKRNHYHDLGQEGIAYLYGKLAMLRGNSKTPSG